MPTRPFFSLFQAEQKQCKGMGQKGTKKKGKNATHPGPSAQVSSQTTDVFGSNHAKPESAK